MLRGSTFTDNGLLIFTPEERNSLIDSYPNASKYFKKAIGSQEFIKGINRWCLLISDSQLQDAVNIPEIKKRLDLITDFRLKSKAKSTVSFAKKPHVYKQYQHKESNGIIVPRVSSIRRDYIPAGHVTKDDVILDSAQVMYDSDVHMLGIISSKMHIVWVKITAGRLKSDFRYSSAVSYNHFPFPTISKQRKEELTQCTLNIIDERLKHSEKTLAQLYDPDKMPTGLREAHHQNDLAVERCYRSTPFTSDEERLEYLFKLYEKMIQEEKDKDTLFAKEKKIRKRK